jgi:ubiquinone/menaquinone biosynthesis C-methylase UbiE
MKKKPVKFHRRSNKDFDDLVKKLELQALETAEERLPLYLEVGLKDADIILDVGCGSGIVTRDLAILTKGKVIGVDTSEDMIKVAKKVLKNYADGVITQKNLIGLLYVLGISDKKIKELLSNRNGKNGKK